MKIIKEHGTIQLVKSEQLFGGPYTVRCTRKRKAKTGLCLDAANDLYNRLIKENENDNRNSTS